MSAKPTVLVIDDDEGIRNALKEHFEREPRGYNVLTAADGVEGVEVFTAHKDAIGLVMSDWDMPRMSGVDALRKIKELKPEVPVILMSAKSIEPPKLLLPVQKNPLYEAFPALEGWIRNATGGFMEKPVKVDHLPYVAAYKTFLAAIPQVPIVAEGVEVKEVLGGTVERVEQLR